jgi:hypothetical protein
LCYGAMFPRCLEVLPFAAMADLLLPKRVPTRVGSGAEPPAKRAAEETPAAAQPSSESVPPSGAQLTDADVIRQLREELSAIKSKSAAPKGAAKAAAKTGGQTATGGETVDLSQLQALAVSTAKLSLAEAHQGRHHRAIVADGVLLPRDTPLVQAIKDRTKELAESKAGLETQQEKDALGEPHCYAWNALMAQMLLLAKDKKETAAEATLSSFVSVHLDKHTSLEAKIKEIDKQVSHCWVARAHKKGDLMLAKLHVGAIMSTDAKVCWECMKELLVKYCAARVLAGTAPRGHQERQVQAHLTSMNQSSLWTDW